jgi:hypothetical protein
VSRRYWGTIYLIRPDWHGDPEDVADSVVESHRDGPSHIHVAIELWRLAGDEDRARKVEDLLERVNERDNPVLGTAEIEELLQLLAGLETALDRSVVGPDWRVPAERLPELRGRSKLLDLDESRGSLASAGVVEGMSRVDALRNILTDAYDRGLHVSLD